jgi:hypothetical protein
MVVRNLTYSCSTGHRPQKAVVDLDDFLDRLAGYPVSGCCSGVCCYDDAALEAEGEGCGAVGELDGAVGVGMVICCCAEEGGGLGRVGSISIITLRAEGG